MTSQLDVARGREIVARWCNLAEQRLEYLTELFETGRWRRFYSEQAFLENVREAKAATEAWRELMLREGSRDNRAIDMSWLGRTRTALPMNRLRRDVPAPPEIEAIPVPAQHENPILDEDDSAEVSETLPSITPAAETFDEDAFAAVLDLATITARYPSLRHTL
jgi:uncharacterized repeat protein (TIGR03809 family)